MPLRLRSPCVGFRPTIPLEDDGPRNRSAGVGAESQRRVRRRDRDAGAARRSRRRPREIVRVERLAAERAARRPRGELRHVQLREHDRAGRVQLLHDEGVFARDRSFEQHRSARRRQIGGVVVVFQHDGDAVQRRARAFRLALRVERARRLDGFRVQREHGAQRRPLPVVGLDAREAQLHEALRGQRAGVERAVDVGDRQRVEVDRLRGGRRPRRDDERERKRGGHQVSLHGGRL